MEHNYYKSDRKGYKIACYFDDVSNKWKPCLVELEIPVSAIVVYPFGVETCKLRTDRVKVTAIFKLEEKIVIGDIVHYKLAMEDNDIKALSLFGVRSYVRDDMISYDDILLYKVGTSLYVRNIDTDPTTICSRGIHFFPTIQPALHYINDSMMFERQRIKRSPSWVSEILEGLTKENIGKDIYEKMVIKLEEVQTENGTFS